MVMWYLYICVTWLLLLVCRDMKLAKVYPILDGVLLKIQLAPAIVLKDVRLSKYSRRHFAVCKKKHFFYMSFLPCKLVKSTVVINCNIHVRVCDTPM